MRDILLSKIRRRTAKVAVFGLGRIGLLKAAIVAETGFQVIGVDLNPKIVKAVSEGNIRLKELGLCDLIKRVVKKGLLKTTTNGSVAVRGADLIIICVPTPIKENNKPDLIYIEESCKTIAHNLSGGKVVIVESTIPPKTTKTLIVPILEEGSGLRCGVDFYLAHCPERTTSGRALKEFIENDRIIGGYDPESTKVVTEFFSSFAKGNILMTDIITAEVAKLSENTFRDINIALANQLALICEQVGVDAWEAIKLANTHPRVNIHTPGPGVGGPCIPKDPFFLLHSAKPLTHNIIQVARQINNYMPKHMVQLILHAMKDLGKDFRNSKITILGTAYKGDIDDSRHSPSEPIIQELICLGAEVTVFDPHCDENFGGKEAASLHEAVKNADCLVIINDHSTFRDLNLEGIKTVMNDKPVIVDGKRIINPYEAKKLGFSYYGIGLGKRGT